MNRTTIFSPDRAYRYTLWREWWKDALPRPMCRDCADHDGVCPTDGSRCDPSDYVQFIGLNPSTADETLDDPTIRRCIGYAKAWGYGALCMTNLFAFRATDPKVMLKHGSPVGEFGINDAYILQTAIEAALIVCAWGNIGLHIKRGERVARMLSLAGFKPQALKVTGKNQPQHPLCLPKTLKPIPYP